jgi:hypothetical protein
MASTDQYAAPYQQFSSHSRMYRVRQLPRQYSHQFRDLVLFQIPYHVNDS